MHTPHVTAGGGSATDHQRLARPAEADFCANLYLANEGDTRALVLVAAALVVGNGCEANPTAGLDILRNMAARGDADGMTELGACYEHGRGVPVDYAAARAWYTKAAEAGDEAGTVGLCALLMGSHDAEAVAEGLGWAFRLLDVGDHAVRARLAPLMQSSLAVGIDQEIIARSAAYGRPTVN